MFRQRYRIVDSVFWTWTGPSQRACASLEQLDGMTLSSPSGDAQLALFAPYCGGRRRASDLRRALQWLPNGQLQGERQLSNAGAHRFSLSWSPVRSPLETTHCELGLLDAGQTPYSFDCPAHRLVQWLMDVETSAAHDLPDGFWRWLLLERNPDERPP